jgi:hypothetical protein
MEPSTAALRQVIEPTAGQEGWSVSPQQARRCDSRPPAIGGPGAVVRTEIDACSRRAAWWILTGMRRKWILGALASVVVAGVLGLIPLGPAHGSQRPPDPMLLPYTPIGPVQSGPSSDAAARSDGAVDCRGDRLSCLVSAYVDATDRARQRAILATLRRHHIKCDTNGGAKYLISCSRQRPGTANEIDLVVVQVSSGNRSAPGGGLGPGDE